MTFASGARLLADLGIDPHATADTVRYIAQTRSDWPFGDPGEGRPYEYIWVSRARTMETRPFLKYFREHPPPPGTRGPDRKPRQPRRRS
ncbi:hypothetical protein [Streptomyces sp. 8L]|uniref:hypothetical protein n=1 Tax=Streptomyces sp. 8L TaxID=2877242 RepID=UPI001CD25BDE|nr:hypothetical protein [Streptomyces sp. 8L]MCA1223709.1 hypothetical protein [Streptomyces sp. 8L]